MGAGVSAAQTGTVNQTKAATAGVAHQQPTHERDPDHDFELPTLRPRRSTDTAFWGAGGKMAACVPRRLAADRRHVCATQRRVSARRSTPGVAPRWQPHNAQLRHTPKNAVGGTGKMQRSGGGAEQGVSMNVIDWVLPLLLARLRCCERYDPKRPSARRHVAAHVACLLSWLMKRRSSRPGAGHGCHRTLCFVVASNSFP